MATAIGAGFDLDALNKALTKADEGIKNLVKSGQSMERSLISNFQNIAENGVGTLISRLNQIGGKRSSLNKFKEEISTTIDSANKFSQLMSKINNDEGSRYRNSAVTKINEELEEAKKRLGELRKLLNFYAKGEGKSAIGFVDTSASQKEAKALMWRIDALEREKSSLQAQARLRIEVARNREKIAAEWNRMERERQERIKESAAIATASAKKESKAYEDRNKAHEAQQRFYDTLGRRMQEQSRIDLGKDYESEEAYRKSQDKIARQEEKDRLANLRRLEEDGKKKSKIAEASAKAENDAMQKAWEEQLKARDKAQQEYIKREEQRHKEQEKQKLNAAVATSNNLDRINEKKHRDELNRIKEQGKANAAATKEREKEAKERARVAVQAEKQVNSEIKRERKAYLDDLSKHALEQQKYQMRMREVQNAKDKAFLNSPKGALEYARNLDSGVKSINTMNKALQQLRNAQANVNTNTEYGRKKYNELGVAIKRVETEMRAVSGASDEVKKKHSKLMDTSGQLMRAMAAIFSVSAIKGYINKLREVRGEFEMQQRSLQILLQNKDKADELWEKTIDLAVKSPFRVKELVTYTKQLAAYRVESDKLYDTTKMLADVSSGLGVDMNRLILAFGQVKAANFLRGTELRQFTEAGIPMLDELAKLFTELEGRAVSAGDVFERISKRMVTFGDVEEVFNRITSAGGVFYKMQEEQSKTLAGLYSNLHDRIDLMLNDIGKANDGLIKGSINVAKEFIENWREVAYVLARIAAGLTAYKLSSAAFALGLKNTTNATLRFNNALTWADAKAIGFTKSQFLLTKALNATKISANGVKVAFMQIMLPALIVGGVSKLVQMMTKANREAKRLKKDLNAIFNEDTSNLERQSDTFKDLVERLKDVNIGSKEHKNIISQLNNQYGEYLGFIVDEKTTYDQLASSINSVTTALTQKAKAASYEKALSRLYEDTDKSIGENYSNIEKQFKKGFMRPSGPKIMPTEEEIIDIFSLIQKKVSETGKKIGDGLHLGDILSEYYGETVIFSATEQHKHLLEYSEAILKRKDEEEKIQRRINNLYGEGVYSTKEYRDAMEKLTRDKDEELSNTKSRSERDKIEYKYKVEEVRLQGRYEGLDDSAIQKRVERIQKVSATVADINRRMGEEADKFGQDAIDRVYITFQDASQGVDAIAEQTAASYKSMQKEIKDQNALKEAGTIHDQKALDNATLMSKVYYRMLEIMGKTELAKEKGAESKELKRLKEQIKLIRDAANAYDDMRKLHDDAYASERIVKDYGNAFKEAGLGDIEKYSFGTREDERNNLKKLEDSANRVEGGMLELSKAIAQVSVNVDDADKELSDKKLFDAISDIFSNYEISFEMDKLNIPSDLAQKLFGFESIDLNEIRGKVLEKFGLGSMVGTSNQGIYDSAQFKAMSKERQDELRKSLEKESELQDNALKERLKTYTQYLKKEQDERIKLKLEELRKLEEVEELYKQGKYTQEQYATITGNIRRESAAEQAKQTWEDFAKTPYIVQMFDDLDKTSNKSLTLLNDQLQTLKTSLYNAGLPASELKEILDKINQVEKELEERNPFAQIGRGLKDLFTGNIDLTAARKAYDEQIKLQKQADDEVLAARERLFVWSEQNGKDNPTYNTLSAQLEDATKKAYELQKTTDEVTENFENAQRKVLGMAEGLSTVLGYAQQLGSAFGDMADKLGIMSEEEQAILDSAMNVVGDVANIGMAAAQIAANPADPTAWVQGISSVMSLIGNIAATGDAVREKEIQSEMKKIDRLEKAYGKLEKAMEEAYNTDQIKANTAAMEQNINAQIKALEAAKAAEEGKKKTDEDAVQQYTDDINELEEKKDELEKEMVETMGGTYDYAGVAEQFLDAWLSAFEETGDGLSGLDQAFDDFWKDILKKQVVYGGASTILEGFIDEINDRLKDGVLDAKDVSIIDGLEEDTKAKLQEFFEYMNSKYDLTDAGKSELSGLSKGIQGITETQADILAAYWNAVRFDVSAIRQRFDDFMAMQGSGEEVNPVENHLKTISLNTTAILTLLGEAKTDSEANAIRVKVLNM